MGLILDLAVAILALLVIVSLALLAWTLAVSCVRAVDVGRARVAAGRQAILETEARLLATAAEVSATVTSLAERTRPAEPGDRSDA